MLEHLPGQLTAEQHKEMAAVKSVADLCGKWFAEYRGIGVELQFLAKFIYPKGAAFLAMVIALFDGACGGPPPTPPNQTNAPAVPPASATPGT